jgi:hypothetical protein
MKKYSMVNARYHEAMASGSFPNAEKTAFRMGSGMDFDLYFQVWPNRASMARSIRMQQSRASNPMDWKPVIKLSDGEGY